MIHEVLNEASTKIEVIVHILLHEPLFIPYFYMNFT
jgi:hypothetical protein